jgi:hypothetical protein
VSAPDGEQVDDGAAVDPDNVLAQQVFLDVGDIGHAEQVQVGELEARCVPRFADFIVEPPLIEDGRTFGSNNKVLLSRGHLLALSVPKHRRSLPDAGCRGPHSVPRRRPPA